MSPEIQKLLTCIKVCMFLQTLCMFFGITNAFFFIKFLVIGNHVLLVVAAIGTYWMARSHANLAKSIMAYKAEIEIYQSKH